MVGNGQGTYLKLPNSANLRIQWKEELKLEIEEITVLA